MAEKKKTVDEYVAALPVDKQPIVAELRKLIKTAVPEVTEAFKWGQPVYESNGPLAYIHAYTNQVNFGFWRGTQLADPDAMLTGDGDRMKHVKLKSVSDIKTEAFAQFLKEAVKLNKELGNPTKGRKAKA